MGAEDKGNEFHKGIACHANGQDASVIGNCVFHCLLRMNTQPSQPETVLHAHESFLNNISSDFYSGAGAFRLVFTKRLILLKLYCL